MTLWRWATPLHACSGLPAAVKTPWVPAHIGNSSCSLKKRRLHFARLSSILLTQMLLYASRKHYKPPPVACTRGGALSLGNFAICGAWNPGI